MAAQLERQLAEARQHAIHDKEELRQARAEMEALKEKIAALESELNALRSGMPTMSIENSRFNALIKYYYGLYNVPVIGTLLRGMRRIVGFAIRMTASDRGP